VREPTQYSMGYYIIAFTTHERSTKDPARIIVRAHDPEAARALAQSYCRSQNRDGGGAVLAVTPYPA
jgi:hypothetical protein